MIRFGFFLVFEKSILVAFGLFIFLCFSQVLSTLDSLNRIYTIGVKEGIESEPESFICMSTKGVAVYDESHGPTFIS